jgi:hypothetical protein
MRAEVAAETEGSGTAGSHRETESMRQLYAESVRALEKGGSATAQDLARSQAARAALLRKEKESGPFARALRQHGEW